MKSIVILRLFLFELIPFNVFKCFLKLLHYTRKIPASQSNSILKQIFLRRLHPSKHIYTELCAHRKSNGRKPSLERPRCKCQDNIKIYLKEVGCEVIGWIHLDHDTDNWLALLNAIIKFRRKLKSTENMFSLILFATKKPL